jgi:hypothetical protein
VKLEAVALARSPTSKFADRVVEPADAANDRHGPISEAVHLVEAAWLIGGGHEEHIGAGLDLV